MITGNCTDKHEMAVITEIPQNSKFLCIIKGYFVILAKNRGRAKVFVYLLYSVHAGVRVP